jgi:hypothetical protein
MTAASLNRSSRQTPWNTSFNPPNDLALSRLALHDYLALPQRAHLNTSHYLTLLRMIISHYLAPPNAVPRDVVLITSPYLARLHSLPTQRRNAAQHFCHHCLTSSRCTHDFALGTRFAHIALHTPLDILLFARVY